ncbi:MAG: hypothetical protein QGG64_27740 [Candidatus Latescibacteria bacterium]|nr:hypothetical protein [Candidatus Latescibacterota bacterium]
MGFTIYWVPVAHAQSTRKMLEKRSIPSAEMWKHLDRVSEFSAAEMRLLDQRSVFNVSEEKMISKRSEFSAAEQRMLTQRSEFSPQMMKLLEKRVEPDAAQVGLLHRQSRPDSRWVRPDRVTDRQLIALLIRRSEMTPPEKKQIDRASHKTELLNVIQRASSFAGSQSRIVSGRSRASATWLRLMKKRSTD